MTQTTFKTALIVGAGPGLGASVARLLAREGMAVALASGIQQIAISVRGDRRNGLRLRCAG